MGKERVVSEKLTNETQKGRLITAFLDTYRNFHANNLPVNRHTLINTKLFRKLSKVPADRPDIHNNVEFITTYHAPGYLQNAAIEINPKAAALARDPQLITFIANLFCVSADPRTIEEEKSLCAPEGYQPSQEELHNREVKFSSSALIKFLDWRYQQSMKVAQLAQEGKVRRCDVAGYIDTLNKQSEPLDTSLPEPVEIIEKYLYQMSLPENRAGYNLLRQALIRGFGKFIESPILIADFNDLSEIKAFLEQRASQQGVTTLKITYHGILMTVKMEADDRKLFAGKISPSFLVKNHKGIISHATSIDLALTTSIMIESISRAINGEIFDGFSTVYEMERALYTEKDQIAFQGYYARVNNSPRQSLLADGEFPQDSERMVVENK